ncbi:MAG: PrgI family protein [Patescibacteria group bacterium]|nr:PrgI family protein [Patescibacteria group bacterium]MCX7589729.1 PrgI family protein [Patescibacteria group bacterium]MDW8279912.1 PrgI family protein [bacterium]
MRFQVPQFIDIEDKIIGPLTLRQFIYIAIAFGISMVFYFTVTFFLWIFVTIIIGGIASAFAFVKINNQPFSRILLSIINFYLRPRIYVWQPENPQLTKTKENIKKNISFNLINSLEKIISGIALKTAQENVLVGSSPNSNKAKIKYQATKEKYEIFNKISGEKQIARRIDYH